MDVHLRILAKSQIDLVAHWQLVAAGYSDRQVDDRAYRHGWNRIHDGVYALTRSPITQRQRWMAACLTAPGTLLAGPSAGACWRFLRRDPATVFVVRHGSGGPRQYDGLHVRRSAVLAAEIAWHGEIPITSVERTLIDLAPHLRLDRLRKATREAIRLRLTTAAALLDALDRHRGWRGTARLREQAHVCAQLEIARTRSDAEAFALERLFRAELPIPAVNVKVNGVEADLVDHERRLIVEIDGPQFHRFADEDEAKEASWEEGGYRTVRLPSGEIYR